jgi:hypothetical protein
MPAQIGRIRQFQPEDAESCSMIVRACLELDPLLAGEIKEELLQAESPEIMRERARLFYMAVSISPDCLRGVGGVDMN